MTLIDDADTYHPGPRGCVELVMDRHPDLAGQLGDALSAVLDQTITAAGLSRSLARRGVRLSDQSILRHVRGICACNR